MWKVCNHIWDAKKFSCSSSCFTLSKYTRIQTIQRYNQIIHCLKKIVIFNKLFYKLLISSFCKIAFCHHSSSLLLSLSLYHIPLRTYILVLLHVFCMFFFFFICEVAKLWVCVFVCVCTDNVYAWYIML